MDNINELNALKTLGNKSFDMSLKEFEINTSKKQIVMLPTCGRMIHYFPVLPDFLKQDNPDYCKMLPAIVVEATDLYVNMVVFGIGSTPCESKVSVPHKSEALDFETKEPTMSYWDWPIVK